MNLYVGCPIWAFKGWVGDFYPKGTKSGDFLFEYARRLTTVEGNTTFYAVPAEKTLQQWAAETPETFRFSPKLPRTISHAGKLVEHIAEALRFVEVMSVLGARLGPMFLQLPPSYPPGMFDDLRAFLQDWPDDVPLAVEVRHMGWFGSPHHATLNGLLSSHRMARVVIDTRPIRSLQGDKILEGSVYKRLLEARQRKPDVPILPEQSEQSEPAASFFFLRYIGHPQYEINEPILDEWVSYLTSWLREGEREAYVFCHCPDEHLDPWLCRAFYRRMAENLPLPPLPWDEIDMDTPQQERLF